MRRVFCAIARVPLFFALIAPRAAHAQIANVQSLITTDKPGWSAQVDASVDYKSWNARQTTIGANAIVRYMRGANTVLFTAKSDAIRRQQTDWQERHLVHARHRRRVEGILDWESFGQHSTDLFRRLQYRFLVGTGPRLRLLEDPLLSAAIGTTPMLEIEKLDNGDPRDAWIARTRVRISTYVVLSATPSEKVRVSQSFYVQPRVNDVRDTRILHELEISIAVTKVLGVKWSIASMHDPRAPYLVAPLDLTVRSGLVLTI